ncbi:MAG: hypothetical protein WBO55_10285 [Rhizobiaceae bacterium]
MKVFKTHISVDDTWQLMGIRNGMSDVLHVGNQGDPRSVQLWFLHEDTPHDELVKFEVRVFGTGQEIHADHATHLGTAIVAGGLFVWHVFAVEVK